MKTINYLCAVLLVLLSETAFGQFRSKLTDNELNAAGPSKIRFTAMVTNCGAADSLAKTDIDRQMPFLCLAGGIAPVAYMPADALVEQKFQFYYYEFGCSPPDEECLISYNRRVFAYLTSKYGNRWAKAVRPDIIGLKAWKSSH